MQVVRAVREGECLYGLGHAQYKWSIDTGIIAGGEASVCVCVCVKSHTRPAAVNSCMHGSMLHQPHDKLCLWL